MLVSRGQVMCISGAQALLSDHTNPSFLALLIILICTYAVANMRSQFMLPDNLKGFFFFQHEMLMKKENTTNCVKMVTRTHADSV